MIQQKNCMKNLKKLLYCNIEIDCQSEEPFLLISILKLLKFCILIMDIKISLMVPKNLHKNSSFLNKYAND